VLRARCHTLSLYTAIVSRTLRTTACLANLLFLLLASDEASKDTPARNILYALVSLW
jgi:hypothetical protein